MTFEIFCKPPQSGKTSFIVSRFNLSVQKGHIPVLVVPNNCSLQKQSTIRIVEGVNINHIDSCISYMDQRLLVQKPKVFENSEIGRWDTGNKSKKRLKKSHVKTLEKIDKKELKGFVVLYNKYGLGNLVKLLFSLKDYKVDFIFDEAHSMFRNVIGSNLDKITQKKVKFSANVLVSWILNNTNDNDKWTITGLTATIGYLVKNKNLDFKVVSMDIPDCYKGYLHCDKKINENGIKETFVDIIKNNKKDNTTVMCHCGVKITAHLKTVFDWGEACYEAGIDQEKIGSMVDNGSGYSLYDYKGELQKRLKKTCEAYKVVMKFKAIYPYLGIFGDICMNQGITYQSCNSNENVNIDHVVIRPFRQSVQNMTPVIQKIGRIFSNDTNNNKRVLWFPSKEHKITTDHGFLFEEYLQANFRSSNKNYTRFNKNRFKDYLNCRTTMAKLNIVDDIRPLVLEYLM